MLGSGGEEESGGPWVARLLLLFKINVGESKESENYPFSQYMAVTCPVDTVNETLACVCSRLNTADIRNYLLNFGTGISNKVVGM